MKIYLDADIIYGFFKRIVETRKKKEKFRTPQIIKTLEKVSRKHSLFTSVLTKAEIARRMKLEYEMDYKKFEQMWNSLRNLLRIKVIRKIEISDDFPSFVGGQKFRPKINNLIHLYLCKNNNLILLTGDKKLKEDSQKVYNKVLTYADIARRLTRYL